MERGERGKEEEETRVRRNQFTKRGPSWILSRSNISWALIRGKIDPPKPIPSTFRGSYLAEISDRNTAG